MAIQLRQANVEADEEYHGEITKIDFSNDPGRTLQEPAEDADINILMKRMGVKDGSALPYFQDAKALYGDFSEWPDDPTELANMMRAGQLAFMKLPAKLRERYRTPEALFAFMSNNENYEEAVQLGLLEKKTPPSKDPQIELLEPTRTLTSNS